MREPHFPGPFTAVLPASRDRLTWAAFAAATRHLHPGMSWTGSDGDVASVIFADGTSFTVAGSGAPVTRTAAGFGFAGGKYLEYRPPDGQSLAGVGAFCRISIDPAAPSALWQSPLSMVAPGDFLLRFYLATSRANSNIGAFGIDKSGIAGLAAGASLVIGVYFDTGPAPEPGGPHGIWYDGTLAVSGTGAEDLVPVAWRIGQNFHGALHEGIIATRQTGSTGPLYPAGANSAWIAAQLAAG